MVSCSYFILSFLYFYYYYLVLRTYVFYTAKQHTVFDDHHCHNECYTHALVASANLNRNQKTLAKKKTKMKEPHTYPPQTHQLRCLSI